MKKSSWITLIIIVAVIIFAIWVSNSGNNEGGTTEEIAKCVGENSVLYVQLGCPHCETQEEMFGDNKKYLAKIDCFFDRSKCSQVSATPTWLIDGEYYEGVQSIEKLRELTGC